jgi:hypothetical protein
MPIVRVRHPKTERFRCDDSDGKVVEEAQSNFCDSNHDNHDFVLYFFNVHSSRPTNYIANVKRGDKTILIESWNKLNDYVSQHCGK